MTTYLWSWFFILPLLVRPGCAHHDSHNSDTHVPRSSSVIRNPARSLSPDNTKRNNAVAIALGVTAGLLLLISLVIFLLYLRKRKRTVAQIEEGAIEEKPGTEEKPQWWHIDLQSAKGTTWWVLETKGGGKEREGKNSADEDYPIKTKTSHLDRLRYFLSRNNAERQNSDLPQNTLQRPGFPPAPDAPNRVARPLPTVPNSHPRYPSILDRPGNPSGFPPPSPFKNPNLARTVLAVESREKTNRRRVQIPPKVLMVPNGRLIANLPGAPRSPSGHRRRSWLSRQAFKNPFLPLKESDAVLPPSVSAGLALRHQMANSPRPRSNLNPPATSPPNASRMRVPRRVPAPIYEERRTMASPIVVPAPPGTGGVPRPGYRGDQRAMKSALPLGYHPRPSIDPRPL
ncbi:hypothetical protein P691DRAFT_805393 [Macrolepiota fuliginosa MF-IS2]|uniref:Uncharacterized protein n=1 Tax=Macrolepiota fuliginosa MF-IS2 TaxID=1400762 RepID=A0A9P5XIU2_9AGAR|nr:hypothetical protein P691DRAFT_805393 [Macrolepiota fuliginosa MF-IS2]